MSHRQTLIGHVICPQCQELRSKHRFPSCDKSGPCSICRNANKIQEQRQSREQRFKEAKEKERKMKTIYDEVVKHRSVVSQNAEICKVAEEIRGLDDEIERLKQQKRVLNRKKEELVYARNTTIDRLVQEKAVTI